MEGIFHTRSGIMWPPTTAVPSAPGAPCLCVVVGGYTSAAGDASSLQIWCPSEKVRSCMDAHAHPWRQRSAGGLISALQNHHSPSMIATESGTGGYFH